MPFIKRASINSSLVTCLEATKKVRIANLPSVFTLQYKISCHTLSFLSE